MRYMKRIGLAAAAVVGLGFMSLQPAAAGVHVNLGVGPDCGYYGCGVAAYPEVSIYGGHRRHHRHHGYYNRYDAPDQYLYVEEGSNWRHRHRHHRRWQQDDGSYNGHRHRRHHIDYQ